MPRLTSSPILIAVYFNNRTTMIRGLTTLYIFKSLDVSISGLSCNVTSAAEVDLSTSISISTDYIDSPVSIFTD